MNDLLVTSVLFMPLIGLIPILFMPKSREHQIKWVALGFSLVTFALAVFLLLNFDTTIPGQQRIYAAVKLFLYTMAGSLLMLLSILWIGTHFGTFDVQQLTDMVQKAGPAGTAALFGGTGVEALLFLGFFAAFAVKVPIWPLHS